MVAGPKPSHPPRLVAGFVRAARIQLQMEATGSALLEIPAEVCERVAAQYEQHDRGRASAEWPAYLRQLDSSDPYWIIDYPAGYHNRAGRFSFADGHAEGQKWLEATTLVPPGQAHATHTSATDKDVQWLQSHCTNLR